MKAFILLCFLMLFIMNDLWAQSIRLPTEHPIYLADSLNESHFEFSGIAKWRDKILLIPQHRSANDDYHIVAIDEESLDSVVQHKSVFAKQARKLIFNTNLDTLYKAIKQAMLPRTDFGGIEAGVVVNDTLFCTIETDTVCYVIKGIIDSRNFEINFRSGDTLSLPKPDYRFANAGFENLVYLPAEHKLLAIYENNAITSAPTAFTFSTSLTNREPVTFKTPLLFRLTDITYQKGNTMIGINHYYCDYSPNKPCTDTGKTVKTEYCYYLANNLAKAKQEMQANPQQTSFTRLVQLTLTGHELSWKTLKTISYSADNWEGIELFKKGVLMVVDGRPPGVTCKLSYFDLQ